MEKNWRNWWKEQGVTLPKKIPFVIFCGCDGTGKSTWMNILSDIIGHTFIFHTSAPPKNMPKNYYYTILNSFLDTAMNILQPIFIDRFHIGELTYGTLFRPENVDIDMENKFYAMENRLLTMFDARIVYVTASPEVIRDRIATRGDWYIQPGNIESILQIYDEKLEKSKLPIFTLDTTNPVNDQTVIDLMKFIYSHK